MCMLLVAAIRINVLQAEHMYLSITFDFIIYIFWNPNSFIELTYYSSLLDDKSPHVKHVNRRSVITLIKGGVGGGVGWGEIFGTVHHFYNQFRALMSNNILRTNEM